MGYIGLSPPAFHGFSSQSSLSSIKTFSHNQTTYQGVFYLGINRWYRHTKIKACKSILLYHTKTIKPSRLQSCQLNQNHGHQGLSKAFKINQINLSSVTSFEMQRFQ